MTSFGFERHLAGNPGPGACRVSVLDPQTAGALFCRRLCSAVDASSRAQRLLWTPESSFETAEYRFYGALSHAASCDSAAADQRQQHIEALARITGSSRSGRRIARRISRTAPHWSGRRSPGSKGRALDASDLYEQAIRSARANGFVHNEALANELAARFYAARGFEKIRAVVFAGCPLRLSALGSRWEGAATRRTVSATEWEERSTRANEHDRNVGRTAGPRDRDQGLAGGVGRDRPGEDDRHAHAHGDRAGGCRARSAYHCIEELGRGSRRKP